MKKAIKGELLIRFQAIDAPDIVVRNRSGDEIQGGIPISAYFASPGCFDDYSLGSVEHPYTVDAPRVGWQFDCVLHFIPIYLEFIYLYGCRLMSRSRWTRLVLLFRHNVYIRNADLFE